MTINAQLPDRSGQTPAPDHDRATHGMHANHPFVVDSFSLLDHRTRECLIPLAGAPAGRYLSVEREGETLLLALERPITHVGRGLVADVRLEDSHVSRRHAIVAVRSDGVRVLDDRSTNGTFVNGRRVTAAKLSDGDVLRFGRAVFRYTEVDVRRRPQPLRRIALVPAARPHQPDRRHESDGAAA
ncbi:MAG: FHA domain-containing protein [Solirubrobacteraceae bacterium]